MPEYLYRLGMLLSGLGPILPGAGKLRRGECGGNRGISGCCGSRVPISCLVFVGL